MKDVKLPSGRTLKITMAPFKESKELYQAVLEEMRALKLDPKAEVDANFFKDLFCVGMASKKIEAAVWVCIKRATIDDLKIDDESFEKAEHRDDYFTVLFEVAKENVQPFTKSLYAQYSNVLGNLQNVLA